MSFLPSYRLISPIACALAIGLGPASLKAELITFNFAGHITRLEGDVGFLGGSIPVGTTFTGSYTFDSDTPDLYPDFPSRGFYDKALATFSAQVGPHVVSGNGTNDDITVGNNLESFSDDYVVRSDSLQLVERIVDVAMVLTDLDRNVFSSDALPAFPPPLTAFEARRFVIVDASQFSRFSIAGEVTSLVPEPEATALLMLGMLTFCRRRVRIMPAVRSALVAVIGLALWAPQARGDLITFNFAGHVTRLTGDVGFLGGSISVGMPFSGTYTFDSNTPDVYPSEPRLGNYDGALTTFILQVGPHTLQMVDSIVNGIRVGNDLDFADSYIAGDRSTPLMGRNVSISMRLEDHTGTAFSTDALPLIPPDISLFDEEEILIANDPTTFSVVGEVMLLIPEPETGMLLFIATLNLGRRRCR